MADVRLWYKKVGDISWPVVHMSSRLRETLTVYTQTGSDIDNLANECRISTYYKHRMYGVSWDSNRTVETLK